MLKLKKQFLITISITSIMFTPYAFNTTLVSKAYNMMNTNPLPEDIPNMNMNQPKPDMNAMNCQKPDMNAMNCQKPDTKAMNCQKPDTKAMNCQKPDMNAMNRQHQNKHGHSTGMNLNIQKIQATYKEYLKDQHQWHTSHISQGLKLSHKNLNAVYENETTKKIYIYIHEEQKIYTQVTSNGHDVNPGYELLPPDSNICQDIIQKIEKSRKLIFNKQENIPMTDTHPPNIQSVKNNFQHHTNNHVTNNHVTNNHVTNNHVTNNHTNFFIPHNITQNQIPIIEKNRNKIISINVPTRNSPHTQYSFYCPDMTREDVIQKAIMISDKFLNNDSKIEINIESNYLTKTWEEILKEETRDVHLKIGDMNITITGSSFKERKMCLDRWAQVLMFLSKEYRLPDIPSYTPLDIKQSPDLINKLSYINPTQNKPIGIQGVNNQLPIVKGDDTSKKENDLPPNMPPPDKSKLPMTATPMGQNIVMSILASLTGIGALLGFRKKNRK